MINTAPWNPCTAVVSVTQPKLTIRSGMANGTTRSTAQIRRPGRSVRSTHHAVSVPNTAQRTVTVTVRLAVFQRSLAVNGRQMRSQTSPAPDSWDLDQEEQERCQQHGRDRDAQPSRNQGGRRRRAGTVTVAVGTHLGSLLQGAAVRGARPFSARRSPLTRRPTQGSRWRWVRAAAKGVSGCAVDTPEAIGILETDRVGDDALTLLGNEEGQESAARQLDALRTSEDRCAGNVEDIAGVPRGEVRDRRVDIGGTDLGTHPIPVVLVHDSECDRPSIHLVRDGLIVGIDVAGGVRADSLEPLDRRRLAVRVATEVTMG